MLTLLIKYKLAVVAAALLGVVGLGGVGVAAANGALPLSALGALHARGGWPGSSAGPVGRHGHGIGDGRARHILHGTVIMQSDGSWVTYTLDVGSVISASASRISLKRADGSVAMLAVSASTRWGPQGAATPKDFSKLTGRVLAILSQSGAAVHIGGRGLLRGFASADLTLYRNGQTRQIQLDRGVVSSVTATQISITRADGVTMTLTLSAAVRYHQAGTRGPAQASAVKAGQSVVLVVIGGQVMGVRIAAAQPTSSSAAQ